MEQRFSYTRENSTSKIKQTIKEVRMSQMSFIIFFASSRFDFTDIAQMIEVEYPGVPSIGCVSTGEITPEGYIDGSFSILAVYSADFKAQAVMLTNLEKKVMLYKRRLTRTLKEIGVTPAMGKQNSNYFIISLIDAFAGCEERMGTFLRNMFNDPQINFVGGSAGDLSTGYSYVSVNGRVEQKAAALLCVKTTKKIKLFNENIYMPRGKMHRVTEADISTRTAIKADGIPFIDLYAKEIGVSKASIDAAVFSRNPIGRVAGGKTYISSPLKVNSDGSITFYSRVLTGRQFYFMEAADMLEKADETAACINKEFDKVEMVLGFNCILRYLQMQNEQVCSKVYDRLKNGINAPYYGFTTLGEQVHMIHVNQTLTLIAIGE